MSIIESALEKAQKSKNRHGGSESTNARSDAPRHKLGSSESHAQIAEMKQERMFSVEELMAKGIIFPQMKETSLLNRYRNLRTRLLSEQQGKNFVTLVTCVVPDSESSKVSLNLAAAFALDKGKTALLINADISNKSLDNVLDISSDFGLANFLNAGERDIDQVMYETPLPRLRYIPSGTAQEHTSEYFTSTEMKHFLSEVKARYSERYPIIDAPSISTSADTRILMELCDRVILVVPYGKCTQEDIKGAVDAIMPEKLVGLVLKDF